MPSGVNSVYVTSKSHFVDSERIHLAKDQIQLDLVGGFGRPDVRNQTTHIYNRDRERYFSGTPESSCIMPLRSEADISGLVEDVTDHLWFETACQCGRVAGQVAV